MSVIVNASTSTGLGITSDNSGTVEIQSNGTTKLTVASTGVYGTITHATAQASTSGTTVDFTSIPSWVKKITVMFNEVSLSGSDYLLVQLGSGSFETSGYLSTGIVVTNAASSAGSSSTSGFYIHGGNSTNVMSGQMILTLVGSNLWLSSHCGRANTTAVSLGGGSKTTSGVVDRVRITTTGASTFDAGSINIMYEG